MKNKTFGILAVGLTLLLLLAVALSTAVIDPYFHYHAPLGRLQYPIDSQRYQNDGIVRNFDYDALITGTSMTENFKTSEFDRLFDATTVKVSFSGGTLAEITSNVRQALKHNPDIRYVLYGIDEWFLFDGADLIEADGEYPTYLYDDDPFNDVKYLLNKTLFLEDTLKVLEYTAQGGTTTSFDEYASWTLEPNAQKLLAGYARPEKVEETGHLSQWHAEQLTGNLRQLLLPLAQEYPDTQFIYFFPPYSILLWDSHNQTGGTDAVIEAFSLASEILMEMPNIQVYSFYTDYETITNLDNYRDTTHYGEAINSLILERIARQEYRLTPENNEAHWREVLDFYKGYDYDAIFAEE